MPGYRSACRSQLAERLTNVLTGKQEETPLLLVCGRFAQDPIVASHIAFPSTSQ
jgi:hypothetical protein